MAFVIPKAAAVATASNIVPIMGTIAGLQHINVDREVLSHGT